MATGQKFANIAQSQTDSVLVAAITGHRIRVTGAILHCGATGTTVTFNSKPAGAGVAISCNFVLVAGQAIVLPYNQTGWFDTTSGEGLTVTTGAGGTVGVQVTYEQH